MDSHATIHDSPPDIAPHLGLQDELRVAYHLLLSGWEEGEAAAWLGLRPELVHSICPYGTTQHAAA